MTEKIIEIDPNKDRDSEELAALRLEVDQLLHRIMQFELALTNISYSAGQIANIVKMLFPNKAR